MVNSALLGQTPAHNDDYLIYKALLAVSPSEVNPIKNYPFGPPPPPDAVYESRSRSLIIGQCFAIGLIVLITGARLAARKVYTRSWGLDDWVILPAALVAITYLGLDMVSETVGCMGKHLYQCTYNELNWYIKIAHVMEPLFYLCVYTIKISITLANRRITGLTSRNWSIAHWVYLAILLILMPISVCLNTFRCSPLATGYSLKAIGALANPRDFKCLNRPAISLGTRYLHIVTDFALLCVPVIIIYRLKIPIRKKLRLGVVFCVGGISCVASVARIVHISRPTADLTWDYYPIYAWNVVDIFFATVVASLPALNALVDTVFHRVKAYGSGFSFRFSGRSSSSSYSATKNHHDHPGSGHSYTSVLGRFRSLYLRSTHSSASSAVLSKGETKSKEVF